MIVKEINKNVNNKIEEENIETDSLFFKRTVQQFPIPSSPNI